MKIKVAETRFTSLCFKELLVRQFRFVRHSLFSLEIAIKLPDHWIYFRYEFSLFTYMYACSVVHVTNICCFEFPFLKFSFGYLENWLLRILLSRIFEKDHEFFASNPTKNLSKIQRLFMENLWEQRTNFVCITFAQYCMTVCK